MFEDLRITPCCCKKTDESLFFIALSSLKGQ